MARTPAPEGARKLFLDEKLFAKINKNVAFLAQAKKDLRKEKDAIKVSELKKKVFAAEDTILRTVTGNWEEIKLTSGIKPPKVEAPKPAAAKPAVAKKAKSGPDGVGIAQA
jgi:hypothetical protein